MENTNYNCHIILVVPDRLFREALAVRLTTDRLDVTQVTGDIKSIPKEALCEPDTILVFHLASGSDDSLLDVLGNAKRENPDVKIVILGKFSSPVTIASCLEFGVSTILDQDISFDSFANYLRFIAHDEQVLPAAIVNTVLHALGSHQIATNDAQEVPVDLTLRERIILAYLTEGATNKHIARYLDIADGTVKAAVKVILRKIDANNRTQAAVWALAHDVRGSLVKEGVELKALSSGWNGERVQDSSRLDQALISITERQMHS